jgi:alkylmercury lyase-like protein
LRRVGEEVTTSKKAPISGDGELPTNISEHRPATVGFSQTPTLYKLHWDGGNEEYVHCGADILLNGLVGDLKGEGRCPVCQNLTQLVVANSKLDRLDPRDAIIHVLEMPTKSGRIWIECESTHIFDKEECFQKWIAVYSGKKGSVASVQDYHNRLTERRSNRQRAPEYMAKLSR